MEGHTGEYSQILGKFRVPYGQERTYQNSDEDLEKSDRFPPKRIPEGKQKEDIGCRDEDAGPERKLGE